MRNNESDSTIASGGDFCFLFVGLGIVKSFVRCLCHNRGMRPNRIAIAYICSWLFPKIHKGCNTFLTYGVGRIINKLISTFKMYDA